MVEAGALQKPALFSWTSKFRSKGGLATFSSIAGFDVRGFAREQALAAQTNLSSLSMTISQMFAFAILVGAMEAIPFFNNPGTVLVIAPIAAGFATDLQMRPDAFMMAVALGAGCDFLTPIGHQCNTLVMGPGGHRFGDNAQLGVPFLLGVTIIGMPWILFYRPVQPVPP